MIRVFLGLLLWCAVWFVLAAGASVLITLRAMRADAQFDRHVREALDLFEDEA